MMLVASNEVLALALIVIYILDSVHFLCVGDALIGTRHQSLSRVLFGWSFELGGRRPYVPNPLTPFWPELRVEWIRSDGAVSGPQQVAADMTRHLQAVRPIGWITTVCSFLIVVIGPVAIVLRLELLFLFTAVLCFLFAIGGCVLIATRRARLGLTVWQTVSITVVSLVCLPCSGNLARAVLRHRTWTVAASDLPLLGFGVSQAEVVSLDLRNALANVQRLLPEDSKEYQIVSDQVGILESQLHERD